MHAPRNERFIGTTFALDKVGFLDFETRGKVDLKAVGTHGYVRNASAIMLSYAIGAQAPQLITAPNPGDRLDMIDLPTDFLRHHAKVMNGTAVWAAWNMGFDRNVWRHSCDEFPRIEVRHCIDVMAQATASGLPPDLAKAAIMSHSTHKVANGKKLLRLFCYPDSTATPETHPNEWAQLCVYALGDITAMRSVFLGTRQLTWAEWEEYWAMEEINERGLAIDMRMANFASSLAREDKTRTAAELSALTAGAVTGVDQIKRMRGWLFDRLPGDGRNILLARDEEVDEETGLVTRPAKLTLTRKHVDRLAAMCATMPDKQTELRVLQIRRYGGSKTPAKFNRMMMQQVDGVLRGQYVFGGAAQTGRASSKGVQIHNLARDTLPYEHAAIEKILDGCTYDALAQLGDASPVSRKLSLLIRPTIVPQGDDRIFVWSDWSQIEARVLPWLAGDVAGARKRLQIFRDVDADPTQPDLYTRTAADISRKSIGEITKPLRQIGKVSELALGFGGGVGALHAMGAGYGLYLTDPEAREIVGAWRGANEWCVKFWGADKGPGGHSYGLWGAAHRAMDKPLTEQHAGLLTFVFMPDYLDGALMCRLPSGRPLIYAHCKYENVAELDDDGKPTGVHNKHLMYNRGYGRSKLWHGIFCENVVQAVAADVLRGTLRRLVERGLDVRLHTHDEILVECNERDADKTAAYLRDIMQAGFTWSDGLPLMSEETIGYYYTKQED
jgi:DNA polymerase